MIRRFRKVKITYATPESLSAFFKQKPIHFTLTKEKRIAVDPKTMLKMFKQLEAQEKCFDHTNNTQYDPKE